MDDGIPHGKDLEGIGTADPPSQSQAGSGGDAAGQFESARTIANILGDLTSEGTTHHTTGAKSDGVFLGDGLPPVPAKLAERIGRWEYIEMYELQPEFWPSQKATEEGTSKCSNREMVRYATFYVI